MSDLHQQIDDLEQLVRTLSKEVKDLQLEVSKLNQCTFKLEPSWWLLPREPLGGPCYGNLTAVAYKIK